ncbi:[FeFe] hydrogenase, group A [Candidatus Woesearchaeota archaeon]|nr:[FeFe] hydrogenase, group A [Candidatus Woesearchaeota archaeon]
MAKLKINGSEVEAKEGEYIIDVAARNGIEIPHLCYTEKLERIGACRLCIVEIKGMPKLQASCCTEVKEGMEVNTHSPRVLEARRMNMQLLLANHGFLSCTSCKENLLCKVQRYASELMIEDVVFESIAKEKKIDDSSVSIRRDNNKCVLCEQCVRVCNDVQTVYAIGMTKRGVDTKITPAFGHTMKESACINCGQCVVACPSGALTERSSIPEVIDALNSDKYLIVQTAPSIRATLGELFGIPAGTAVTGKMVTALKQIGFDKVFDTNLGADICIMEEANEFVERVKGNKVLPMITTCCPAWIKFGEQFYYEELNKHMSTCRSPQAMIASLVKTYYAKKIKKDPKDIILVDIMPCTAKKYEILRPEFKGEADFVLTTVELGKLLKELNVNFANLPESEFDNPLGFSTGAADIFGHTGGVMEAALRTAADWLTGKDLKQIDYTSIRGMDEVKEAELDIAGKKIKICVVHTIGAARKLLEQIKTGKSQYHFIEIMACYGGCIGGGGQPPPHNRATLRKRTKALIGVDEGKKLRKSHQNPAAVKLYKEYLGKPGSERAHKLLHTHYSKKTYI